MTSWTFIPEQQDAIEAPYYENARANIAPYYSSTTTMKAAQRQVINELGKLNAAVTNFQPGKFDVAGQPRYGYVIEFLMNGASGRIRVAGLPMRSYTVKKETAVRVQCLLNVRDWLKAAVTMQVFSPDTSPLIPYLLVPGANGQSYTVAEYILSRGNLPMLAAESITVEKL